MMRDQLERIRPAGNPGEYRLDERYTKPEGFVFLTGMQTLVRLLADRARWDRSRGLNSGTLVSGYPGSPVGGFDIEVERQRDLLAELDVTHIPAVNEELAATAIYGSQAATVRPNVTFDGIVGMWYGKTMGLERAGDALRHGSYAGTGRNGGVLFVCGDDPAAKSSSFGTDSIPTLYNAMMPIVAPGVGQEILDLGLHAYALSRASGAWVGMKLVTDVADGASTIDVSPARFAPTLPSEDDVASHILNPNFAFDHSIERAFFYERQDAARLYARENGLYRTVVRSPDDWLGIVTSGKTYYDVMEALARIGLTEDALRLSGIRVMKLGLIFPIDRSTIGEFAHDLEEVVVIEEKRSFIEAQVKEALYGRSAPRVVGKFDPEGNVLFPADGVLEVERIALALAQRIRARLKVESIERWIEDQGSGAAAASPSSSLPLAPIRTGFFCSGCPHNKSTKVGVDSEVGGGVGCHGLASMMDRTTIGPMHMGSEGAQWVGMAPFMAGKHFVQYVGDGTFHHSASLALRFAIAAGVNLTYKLLYNSAVAMTGGQAVAGQLEVPELTRYLEAEGVRRIIITSDHPETYKGVPLAQIATVWHRDRLDEAEAVLSEKEGVTVLIHVEQCAAEQRRLRKRGQAPEPATRIFINERVCEGCGDCGEKSNCLSVWPVDTEFGRKTQIDQQSCNKDYTCLKGDCPSFVSVIPGERSRRTMAVERPVPVDVPEPVVRVPHDGYSIYMVGIGGTGVVTVNQILGTAATIDGLSVLAFDQTGMAQKGGTVVSNLRLSKVARDWTNRVPAGGADVYIAFDLLGAVRPDNLSRANPDRTVAFVSTSQVPTGQMVADTSVHFPEVVGLSRLIDGQTRARDNVYLDIHRSARSLFNDATTANLLLVGAAYQAGYLPVSRASIRRAIELNGVAVNLNLLAFEWGRLAIHDRGLFDRAGSSTEPDEPAVPTHIKAMLDQTGLEDGIGGLLAIRIPELEAYQDAAYAGEYFDFVLTVARQEQERTPGATAVTKAVARHLFDLMAYKDEYEVARLHLDLVHSERLTQEFGPGTKFAFHLHPPLLRAMGMNRKLKLGAWVVPVLRALYAMRRLRGTLMDPFGYTKMRRTERALITTYRDVVASAIAELDNETHDVVAELAKLPEMIRGYEDIKFRNIARFEKKVVEVQQRLRNIRTGAGVT